MGEGDLDYSGDESLTALPAGLERVEGDLILKGCVKLTELPECLTFVVEYIVRLNFGAS